MGKQRAEARAEATKIAVLNCIDLSNPDTNHNVNLIKQAWTDSGFFYIANHGISQDFMDEVFAQSKKIFTLPVDQKMKLLKKEKHRGYTPLLNEVLDPQNQVNGDYKEGYYVGVEVDEDDPKSQKPFYGPNIWPAPDILLPGWRETVERFQREALNPGRAHWNGMMRMLCYEACISDPSQGLYGAGAHTDYGLLTLLATDDVAGLQVIRRYARDAKPQIWEDVAPMKGAFIVNLGNMLEHWSNCIFNQQFASHLYSGPHCTRVIGIGQERHSTAYFVEPGHDCLVECLPTCKSDSNPPKEYLSQRYKDTHLDLHIHKKQQSCFLSGQAFGETERASLCVFELTSSFDVLTGMYAE